MKKIGLIVNPIAGMGGAVGLKGTDGSGVLAEARRRGARPWSRDRVMETLTVMHSAKEEFQLLTCGGGMGEDAALESGFRPHVVYTPVSPSVTSAADTYKAAEVMLEETVDLLLFAGGDGTARDIAATVGSQLVVLGIPSGVKIHSAVYAAHPVKAGELAIQYLRGQVKTIREAEVMDIDEKDYRREVLSAKLYGYLRIPFRQRWVQTLKTGSPQSERYNQEAIAHDVVESMADKYHYLMGPGTTTRAVMEKLGLDHSLLGVDLVYRGELLGKDLGETQILDKIGGRPLKIMVTPIGGQGFIFGRGNQQLSPAVIKRAGKDNIIIIAAKQKINSLLGRPLWVDTGDSELDRDLAGYYRVVTGYHEHIIYKVSL